MNLAEPFGAMLIDSANSGSDRALRSVARLVGMGPAEVHAAFGQSPEPAVPRWALVTLSVAGGFLLGAYLQRRWPARVGKLFGG